MDECSDVRALRPWLVERVRRAGQQQLLEATETPFGSLPSDPRMILIQDVTARMLAEQEREDALLRKFPSGWT